jgi:DNA-directed RNA polymerase specialized sigma24 family protein
MLKSHAVSQHVPYLRRYARALTGNQGAGDSYVAATLEALVKDPSVLQVVGNPRIALFRLFSAIWNSIKVNATVRSSR